MKQISDFCAMNNGLCLCVRQICQKNIAMFYHILDRAHSGLRWVVLALLLWAVAAAFQAWQNKRSAGKAPLYAMSAVHLQLLLGVILYFISPYVRFESGVMKDTLLRFYTVEHISMMLLAVVLVTVGYVRAKRQGDAAAGSRRIFWFYLASLLLILAAIPWPFRQGLNGNWF